ncbi:signal peptide peptidase SppA [Sphingorhabdus sp. Alg239-R122]|uniref:signal peptide peptidase SppA n=1 Tax=Sphingorhabdus sp. Alg239-R122 TaxID=2305989 RepID=UPI0013DC2980|nr:signal peptide peptidase SppA [Sphingorhabdus sp. Alg239-R122]
MDFVKKAWKILVAVKDGLVLVFMLLFFMALFALMSSSPNPASVKEGALLVDLNGVLVEEKTEVDPFAVLTSGSVPIQEYQLRDVVRAIEGAAADDNVKTLVLDLDRFMGGGQVSLTRVGEAIDKVKKAGKPVYAFATAYYDDSYQLAAHADEIWMDDMGGALFSGPGGSRLYYSDLINRLGITAHIYKVGTYKSAVEPYSRSSQSPEAKENAQALYDALWSQWKEEVGKVRPKAKLDAVTQEPASAVTAANGDLAKMAIDNGLVDKIGSRVEFGRYVAKKAGFDEDGEVGNYDHTSLNVWLAANDAETPGERIGVATISGEIVDGNAGPGVASGDRIAELLYKGLADDDLKALVVRVNSPGGSALASEQMRRAMNAYREKKIPVVISMGDVAASGGYWVATAGDHIMAEPSTITGSIGIFAVLPSFEKTLAKYGVNADGVTTTPLSGQPDLVGGFNESLDTVIQSSIENNYGRFLKIVSDNRKKTPEEIDAIGQGRVWDGGAARQLGLVDSFGSLDEALAKAAELAKIEGDYHAHYLETPVDGFSALLANMFAQPNEQAARQDVFGRIAQQQKFTAMRAISDMQLLLDGQGVQARCLECAADMPPNATLRNSSLLGALFANMIP